jgi:alkanesulfonate monooxygenase SsuD/methylene tetrahydromethanopterin reductase-like flavin-dependent oxidoreductase (luciferase family)
MIATAAERTRHIKLGTGVISVSYHNPLWVAERIVLPDHLTRGRAMLGLGPGSLPTDGVMIGLQQSQTRGPEDGVAIITKLLTRLGRKEDLAVPNVSAVMEVVLDQPLVTSGAGAATGYLPTGLLPTGYLPRGYLPTGAATG